eukprot:gnl/MRDRNA2_/MRDRNA2_106541_c0_seq1.p1 gnl/MRDRNA2_/MRDRNA2_106541_c0~~gnl/MRDRNA2_/MRDRNA2_106541_c0_seq1.p1  ORF type:complete len:339 (-),score=66.03 gnl/MRDRNA2_/MRDRNA2_106541_c0_seq1:325-1341(-)
MPDVGHLGKAQARGSVQVGFQTEVDAILFDNEREFSDCDWNALRSYLFLDGVSINRVDSSTLLTTLHRCAYAGERDIANCCIKTKADVNFQSKLGRTPLHYAVDGNKSSMIRVLLAEKADVNAHALSGCTPLHIACRNGSYDSVSALLGEKDQIVDIDFEDSRRMSPEKHTTNKKIISTIRRYRDEVRARREKELVNASLQRLFRLFDRNNDGFVQPEEWVDTQATIAHHFEECCDFEIQRAFQQADTNHDGKVDFEEFKKSHEAMLSILKIPFREIMIRLADLESMIFQEHLQILDQQSKEQTKDAEPEHQRPVVHPTAKKISRTRTLRSLANGDKD